MNILFLAPRMPLPADTGGKIRTFNILKQIALKNRVHLVCFSFEAADQQQVAELNALGIEVTLVPIQDSNAIEKIRGILLDPLPISMLKYRQPQMYRTIEGLLKTKKFGAVHVDHLHMSHYCGLSEAACFLDEHNVEYLILERCSQVETSGLKKKIYAAQAAKMKKFEAVQAAKFDGIFACSSDDKEILRGMASSGSGVHVVPNGVDTQYFDPRTCGHPQLAEEALAFTGSMDWLPNEDAMVYFCTQVLPIVRQTKPEIKLYIVGKSPSAQVQALAVEGKVMVTGRVDDVRSYIQRAKIFIAPLRIGGGTRLKILEAMSMAKPVVATSIGAEGIEYTPGVDIALGESPQEMAAAILQLLGDEGRAAAIGSKARELVCQKYDWKIVGEKLNTIYQEAAHAA